MSTYPSHDMPQDRKAQRAETLEPAQTIKSTTSPRDGQLSSTHDFQILPNPSKPQYLPPPSVPSYRRESEASAAHTINRSPTVNLVASPWRHMEKLLYGIRLFDGDDHICHESPRQCPRASYNGASLQSERPLPRTEETDRQILKTKTRLRSMLQCQYSFGSIVGAPVIFFLGGFVFSFLSSLDNLGDEDIAESIAFGSWYMIIPHIAIVSGLLLAGNNPNILEGVFATERDEEPDAFYLLGLRFDLVYPSCYKTAWQWHRGHTKRRWIEQLLRVYGRTVDADRPGERADDDDLEQLRGMTALGSLDWFLLLGLTYLLVGVPYVLAFLMAYFTPQIGLSCRSLTLTVYFCTQTAQLGLWLWAYAGPPPARRVSSTRKQARSWHLFDFARRGGWLHRKGFYDPSNLDWLLKKDGRRQPFWTGLRSANLLTLRAMWCATYYVLSVVFGIGAIFTSLGGTLMQIMGVYRTAMCYTNVPHWLQPYADRPMVVLSVNTEEMIDKAVIYWRPCAITAIVFMAGVSFIGWWYQRRMRDMFSRMVKKIDDAKFECVDAKAARQQGLSRGVSPLMKGVGM